MAAVIPIPHPSGGREIDSSELNRPSLQLHQNMQALLSLIERHEKIIKANQENIEIHEKFKADYILLRDRLKIMPNKLEYEALVPMGPKVLAYGKIVHTNEIMCLLGDNWFVECTAKTATGIVNNRIKRCNDMLEKLKKEGELFTSWKYQSEQQLTELTDEDGAEIVEEYDEAREKKWRQEHRKKVRKYHQELAKNRKDNFTENNSEDEEMWKRLDKLEIEESLTKIVETQGAHFSKSREVLDESLFNSKQPNTKEQPKSITSSFTVLSKPNLTTTNPISQFNVIERNANYSLEVEPTASLKKPEHEKRVSKFKQSRLK